MNRHPQWEQRLHALIEKRLRAPHEWSRHDCIILSADVVKAVTGKDHARGHRGRYNSLPAAYRYLRDQFSVESPEKLLDSFLEQKPVGFAQRGDLVLCDFAGLEDDTSPPGPVPGVCMGAFALCIVAEHEAAGGREGLVSIPRGARWLKAWAVGDHHSSCGQ